MVQLVTVYEQLQQAGVQLWAVSPQDQAANQALRERRELPFPILADSDQAVIRSWGLFNALDPKQRAIPYPATYIIDRNGRVRWFRLGLEARDRPTAGELLAAATALAAA